MRFNTGWPSVLQVLSSNSFTQKQGNPILKWIIMICNSNKIYFNWNYWPWTLTTGQDLRYTKGWGCPDSWPSNVGDPAWFCKCHEESSVNIFVIRNKVSVLCINVSVQLWSSEANNHIFGFPLLKKKNSQTHRSSVHTQSQVHNFLFLKRTIWSSFATVNNWSSWSFTALT